MVDVAAKRSEVSAGSFGAAGRIRAGGPPGPSAPRFSGREPRAFTAGGAAPLVLWDSSAIHPTDAGMDGRRLVVACGAEHVAELRAAARLWVDEEFWAGRL